jgi:uncharacterized membrane protein (Fun14 family)
LLGLKDVQLATLLKKIIEKKKENAEKPREKLQRVPSPFTAKSVWAATGLCVGAGSAMVSEPSGSAIVSWLQGHAPAVMGVAGSYLGGFFAGWGARKTIKITSMVTVISLAAVGLLVSWGWDGAGMQSWINLGSAWVGESVEGAGRYLISFLPSATAAGAGGVLGFRRK